MDAFWIAVISVGGTLAGVSLTNFFSARSESRRLEAENERDKRAADREDQVRQDAAMAAERAEDVEYRQKELQIAAGIRDIFLDELKTLRKITQNFDDSHAEVFLANFAVDGDIKLRRAIGAVTDVN